MIKISDRLKAMPINIHLGVIIADVRVEKSSDFVLALLQEEVDRVEKLTLETYKNETLEDSRKLYRALGKDPTRYRISSDSLFRRIIKQKGVYYVNNVVDINNIISLRTLWSVGAYDLDKVEGAIKYGVGNNEIYEGIGRGVLNIENLPVLIDQVGPFGSATSDSLRTMVTETTERVMMVIHAYGEADKLQVALDDLKTYLESYAMGKNIKSFIIS